MSSPLARLLALTTRSARLAALVAVGLVLGAVLGAAALSGSPLQVRTVVDGGTAEDDATDKAKAEEKAVEAEERAEEKAERKADKQADKQADKAERTDGPPGVHGACVSAVAQDKDAVGGPHDNHGWAVSRAAHTCPNPQP